MDSGLMDTEKMIEFAQALIQLPSLSGDEAGVAQRVVEEMQALGFDQVLVDENGSVVGIIEGAAPGKTLLLDAHMDTVGVAEGVAWRHDPFGAEIVDQAIVGRGAADMKGALAAMVYAAASAERSKLRGRIAVSATTLEEVLEGVTLETVMRALQPDFVVIGEATDLNLNRGGRGRAEVHLATIGHPAHSSSPHLGRNAVLDMMQVIAAIDTLTLPSDALMGPAILALTDIISDPYPGYSVIPSLCKVTYDRRLLPGERPEDVVDAIRALPALQAIQLEATIAVGAHDAYTGKRLHNPKFFPAWVFPEGDWYVQHSLAGLQHVGLQPQVSAYRFCTNGAYSAGIAGVPTVGFGPATEGDAHVVDERLRLDDLFAAARGYHGIIHSVLG
jgi:putative selenium metabolism hydrolase